MKNEHDTFHLGVKALLSDHEGKILLLKRDRYWDIPGGRLQRGESLIGTLKREVQEETGLIDFAEIKPFLTSLTDIRIPTSEGSVGLVFTIFHCPLKNTFHPVLSEEHIDFGWFTPIKAAEKLKPQYPSEFIEKLITIFN